MVLVVLFLRRAMELRFTGSQFIRLEAFVASTSLVVVDTLLVMVVDTS
jgi:hypothetical protein